MKCLSNKLSDLRLKCKVSHSFILGKVYTAFKMGYGIDVRSDLGGLIGYFDQHEKVLCVSYDLDPITFAETLLHEYYHMIQCESMSHYWTTYESLPDPDKEGISLKTFREIMQATKDIEWDVESRCIEDILSGKFKTNLKEMYITSNLNVLQHDVMSVCGREATYSYNRDPRTKEVVPDDRLVYSLAELPNKTEVLSVMKEAMFKNVRRDRIR